MAKPNGVIYSSAKSPPHPKLYTINHGCIHSNQGSECLSLLKLKFSDRGLRPSGRKLSITTAFPKTYLLCRSTKTHNTDTEKHLELYNDNSNVSSSQGGNEHCIITWKCICFHDGLAEACKFVSNDAKFVNERARNDIVLLSRGIMKLDAHARKGVAFLGSEFLKLDARAKEDTELIDHDVKRRAERIHHIASFLKNKAQSKLKNAADKHWSNGALEADLKRADFVAKQRAVEDSLMALENSVCWSCSSPKILLI